MPAAPDYRAAGDLLRAPGVVVVPHTDADGLAAGAIALVARGDRDAGAAVLLARGATPFYDGSALPAGRPVAVLDWGVRPLAPPGLIVDHHAPESAPRSDQLLVSGYGEAPAPSTSVLMRRIVPDAPAWLAALGAVGDYGDAGLRHPAVADAPHRTAIRKLVPLVNAPRRLRDGPVRTALQLLLDHDDPRQALKDPRVAELEEARRVWRAAYDQAVTTAPARVGGVYVIRFSSSAQVHPLVAGAWARRLAPFPVLAANDNYLPGRVNFAIRGGSDTLDLRALLRRALPDTTEREYANGHDRATGGSLPFDEFDRLLASFACQPGLVAARGTAFAEPEGAREPNKRSGADHHGRATDATVHRRAAPRRADEGRRPAGEPVRRRGRGAEPR